jgi:cytochrome c oxidase cbb3-type subunit III
MNRNFTSQVLSAGIVALATAASASSQAIQDTPTAAPSAAAAASTGAANENAETPPPIGPIPGPNEYSYELPNPYGNDAIAATAGRRLFVAFNCSGCHGGHAGGGMGPSLRDADWIYGGQPVAIFDSISRGRAHGMPAWGTMLPPESMWLLVTYIQSLRTDGEPDPPQ